MHTIPLLLLLASSLLGPRAQAAHTPPLSLPPSEPYRVTDPYGAVFGALEAKHAKLHKDRVRTDLEREYGRPPSPQEQFYADLGRPLPPRKDRAKHRTNNAGGDDRREHRYRPKPQERPVVELDFGYNKGSKYDNGYGCLKAFDQTYDFGSLEELAAGIGHDPAYIWGARGERKETEAIGDCDDGALGRGE